jgi:hypothetical protein
MTNIMFCDYSDICPSIVCRHRGQHFKLPSCKNNKKGDIELCPKCTLVYRSEKVKLNIERNM